MPVSLMSGRSVCVMLLGVIAVAGCATRKPPASPQPSTGTLPPPATTAARPAPPAAAPAPVGDALILPVGAGGDEAITSRTLDDLNRESPLRPVFFPLDGFELDADAIRVIDANAAVLRRQPSWVITIEGHCDERGTAEYNLALGERRAGAVRAYLVSLGIPQERLRMVSFGKEFPFDSAHTDAAWAKNRRAHFVIAAQ
jgi:peptidoglycan-associated lipoprotein